MSKIQVKIKINERKWDRTARNPSKAYFAKARVYFSHEGETILDNLLERGSRPTKVYKTYLGDVAEALGLPRTTKFRWSQYAGCTCPCSPGFICDDVSSKDVWVTLKGAPRVGDDEKSQQRLAQRAAALLGPDVPRDVVWC